MLLPMMPRDAAASYAPYNAALFCCAALSLLSFSMPFTYFAASYIMRALHTAHLLRYFDAILMICAFRRHFISFILRCHFSPLPYDITTLRC